MNINLICHEDVHGIQRRHVILFLAQLKDSFHVAINASKAYTYDINIFFKSTPDIQDEAAWAQAAKSGLATVYVLTDEASFSHDFAKKCDFILHSCTPKNTILASFTNIHIFYEPTLSLPLLKENALARCITRIWDMHKHAHPSLKVKAFSHRQQDIQNTSTFLTRNNLSFLDMMVQYTPLISYWKQPWHAYLQENDMAPLRAALEHDMDVVSKEYVEKFLALTHSVLAAPEVHAHSIESWTSRDREAKIKEYLFEATEDIPASDVFMHANKYGLDDIYAQTFAYINGKAIIDGGAYTGDTALLFSSLYPQSTILSFEPQAQNFAALEQCILEHNLQQTVRPILKGLGHKDEMLTLFSSTQAMDPGANIFYNDPRGSRAEISVQRIDTLVENENLDIGFIKLDIEGYEKKALEGARTCICQQKPVILAAIYHNPVDFFEIKAMLLELNPQYRFMIRRSEMHIPLGDIILIAY